MSFWQFAALVDGAVRESRGNKPEPPTDEEYDDAMRWLDNHPELLN